jgi:methyl coenzyme M reductase alpha subunit
VGAEAMHGDHAWPGAVTSSAVEFANNAVALYNDEARWQDARLTGYTLLNERYSQSEHGLALIEKLRYCQQHLHSLRAKNFTGSMLRHHAHKSTQYMSQWIEAKNNSSQQVQNS